MLARRIADLTMAKVQLRGSARFNIATLGRRTSMGGTYACVAIPSTVTSASYDAGNRLTNWGGAKLSYDTNDFLTTESYCDIQRVPPSRPH